MARDQRRRLNRKINTQPPDPADEQALKLCLVEAPPGLEDFTRAEINQLSKEPVRWLDSPRGEPGSLEFLYRGNLFRLNRLKTAHALYRVERFAIPRPKALLGQQHFQRLRDSIAEVLDLWEPGAFRTLYISAAGSGSSVMERLKVELSAATGLAVGSQEGDLLLRIRRPPDGTPGWEVLVRTSPRPLSTREWRVCNFEGALNAAVAAVMCRLNQPDPEDIFINLACGSGSLLVERLFSGAFRQLIGIDLDPEALTCARQNLAASGVNRAKEALLVQANATSAPLPDACAGTLVADLPFGHLVGSHAENVDLYPRLLAEAARLARRGARFVLITHEVRLVESLLVESTDWATLQVLKVWLGGLNPRIFVLERY